MVAERRTGTRETRGHLTRQRLATALAGMMGVPYAHAYELVGAVLAALREDIDTASRVVIPGVLVIERNPDGARRSHRVRFVLNRRRYAEEWVRARRCRSG